MEEKLTVTSLEPIFYSHIIPTLNLQLYDFQDNLLTTIQLTNTHATQITIHNILRNFYIRLINIQNNISQLFSYFWLDGAAQIESLWLSQEYNQFTFKTKIEIRNIDQQNNNIQIIQQNNQIKIDIKNYLNIIKQKVFINLQKQNFFKIQNTNYRCNFIRKKNHKNLTTLLVKNSTNILKTINENINKSSILRCYNQINTTDSYQATQQTNLSLLPPPQKLKKVNSAQQMPKKWSISQNTNIISPIHIEIQQNIKKSNKKICIRSSKLKKRQSGIKINKNQYYKQLQKQTILDLNNQKQTLFILHSYIQSFQSQNISNNNNKSKIKKKKITRK